MYRFRSRSNIEETEKIEFDGDTRILIKRIWFFYLRHHKKALFVSILSMMIVALGAIAQVRMVKPAFDYILEGTNLTSIFLIIVIFVMISIIKGVFTYVQNIAIMRIGYDTIFNLQNQMFDSFIRSDIAYLDKEGTSKQLSRFFGDVNQMRFTVANVFISIGKESFILVGLFGLCFYLNWRMTLLSAVAFPLIIIPVVHYGLKLRKLSKDYQLEIGEMVGIVDDALKGARQLKIYGRESYERQRSRTSFERIKQVSYATIHNRSVLQPILETVLGVFMGLILAWGGYAIFSEEMSVGTFMTFFVALLSAYQPVRFLARINTELQAGLGAAKRVFEVIDTRPTIVNVPNATDLQLKDGILRLENITFRYDNAAPVIKNISLTAKRNQTIALVGLSGSGKTTILSLISRLYDIHEGAITIDNQNIRDVTIESLRKNIATVAQDTWMFNSTVFNNIAYGRENATRDDVIEAAKAASAHEFIMELPDQYDTIVGERGLRLSCGQRQRISIACALLKNAPILLLDEATSSLDTLTERKVQNALNILMRNRTTVVVAHRLSTIINADKIYVVQDGVIVEQGTHQTLIGTKGVYAQMYLDNDQKKLG